MWTCTHGSDGTSAGASAWPAASAHWKLASSLSPLTAGWLHYEISDVQFGQCSPSLLYTDSGVRMSSGSRAQSPTPSGRGQDRPTASMYSPRPGLDRPQAALERTALS